jgi:putative transposase
MVLKKDFFKDVIIHYGIKDVKDIEFALKDMFKGVIEEALQAELTEDLGYSKHDFRNKNTGNSRNGSSKKHVNSSFGEMSLTVPRDRYSEFEPQVVKKGQSDVSGLEDKILSLYGRGMTTRDINQTMNEIYGVDLSAETISKITDKIIPVLKEWQNRPLQELYTCVYLDGFHANVKTDGTYAQKCAHIVMGIGVDGKKDILGFWLSETESAKFWLSVLNDLKARGVKDMLIACIDGLTGFESAIKSAFPQTKVQRCIVHHIRNCCRFVSYKDIKSFCADMKGIYKAVNEEASLVALDEFSKKWNGKYTYAVKSWYDNWDSLATFFSYSPEIRKLIYTTNPIESFNRMLRKHTKNRCNFPTDDALLKVLYLATINSLEKWNMRARDWNQIINELIIHFPERVEKYV